MGWKSTTNISREEARSLILNRLLVASDTELGNIMDAIFGDDPNLPYYGYNFIVTDDPETFEYLLF